VGNRVQFSPFALVCRDTNDPAREPLVITSHTARIQFEQPFKLDLGASSPGRIIAAALEGPVRISGPDGLLIGGQDFVFSEEARHLYSEWPVQFSYGPPDRERSRDGEASEVQGSAEGLQMDLLPGFEGAMGRRDLPRIAGIERIRLRRNVRMRLTQARDGKTRTAHVTCNGSFEYNVAERIATFEDDVLVECPTSPPDATPQQADRLQCTWLALLFEEAPEEESTPADAALAGAAATGGVVPASASSGDREFVHPFGNLRFQRLRARGERDVRAALQSEENDLIANMQELHYDARTRVVALLDNDAVLVQQGALKLACPEIALVHDEQDRGGGMQSLFCRGKGDLTQRDDRGRELKAFWTEQLRIDPDPATGLTLIQADGSAKVIQPGQVGIVADHLLAWVDGDLGGRTLEAGTRKSEAGESGVRGQGSGVGVLGELPS
jgi:hypothetical protein